MHNFFFLHSSVKKDFCIENWIVNQIRIFLQFNNIKMHIFLTWLSMQQIAVIILCMCMKIRFSSSSSFSFLLSRFGIFFLYRSKHEIERIGVITDATWWWSSIVSVWREIYREKNKKIVDVNVKRERENFFAVVIVSISMRI